MPHKIDTGNNFFDIRDYLNYKSASQFYLDFFYRVFLAIVLDLRYLQGVKS